MSFIFSKFPAILFAAFAVRLVVVGASIGDALALLVFGGLVGYKLYLRTIKKVAVNEIVLKDVAELKSNIQALKLAKSMGR